MLKNRTTELKDEGKSKTTKKVCTKAKQLGRDRKSKTQTKPMLMHVAPYKKKIVGTFDARIR